MAGGARWRRACALSLAVHGIFLVALGWVSGQAFMPSVDSREIVMEIQLADAVTDRPDGRNSPPYGKALSTGPQTAAAAYPAHAAPERLPPIAATPAGEGQGAVADYSGSGAVDAVFSPGNGPSGQVGGPGPARQRGQLDPPRILAQTEPVYPDSARQSGLEGRVLVRIEILTNGLPGEVSVQQSSGSETLDAAAISAVRRWKFMPAQEHESGRAVISHTTVPIVFKLRA